MMLDTLARNAILVGGAGCQNVVPMPIVGGMSFPHELITAAQITDAPAGPARHHIVAMGNAQRSFVVFASRASTIIDERAIQNTTNLIWHTSDSAIIDLPLQKSSIEKLAEDWLRDTQWDSSFHQIMQHPSFPKLRDIGNPALAFAMSKLRIGDLQMHWFLIVKSITGEDPTPPASRGRLKEMALSWLDWYDHQAIDG